MRHVNIPVFIPHLGCPHTCVFCNQKTISGTAAFDPAELDSVIERALRTVSPEDDCEIAFFGGSFTGIDRGVMTDLLDRAERYVSAGRVSRIRCSTRPDYISGEILDILDRYTVGTVELGIQSVSDRVLALSERGHGKEDSRRACELLRERGYTVGGQMMIGLPGSSPEDEIDCARFIADCGCREARVYPTIVFRGTALSEMMRRGEYEPLSVGEAVARTADVLEIFDRAGVRVLRVGLCDSENLHNDEYEAGPNHASIGELSSSRLFLKKIRASLAGVRTEGRTLTVCVPRGAVSKAVGNRGCNRCAINEEYKPRRLLFREDGALSGYEIKTVTD